MHIGLIGGIGPAATIAYYSHLVERFKAVGLPLEITIAHADIESLAENAMMNRAEEQAAIFARHIAQLEGAGCDVVTIGALTGHFCLKETKQLARLPIVNALSLIEEYCKRRNFRKIGLLGSFPVMKTHLFGLLRHTRTVTVQDGLESIGESYMNMAQAGQCSDEMRGTFFSAGAEMVESQGADAILLAGTDLGLAFDGFNPGFETIDALEIHCQGLLKLASP